MENRISFQGDISYLIKNLRQIADCLESMEEINNYQVEYDSKWEDELWIFRKGDTK